MKLINQLAEYLPQQTGIDGIYKQIELAGRTSYLSWDKMTDDSAKRFVDMLIKSKHMSCLEHGAVYLKIQTDSHSIGTYLHKGTILASEFESIPYAKTHYDDAEVAYITINYRSLLEYFDEDDIAFILRKYLCEPTEFHEKRLSVKVVTSRGISHELVRHRSMSFIQESQRYVGYNKDKYDGEITYIIPDWLEQDLNQYPYDRIYVYHRTYNLDGSVKKTNFKFTDDKEAFIDSLCRSEHYYMSLISLGHKPQEARDVLPNATKTTLVITAFESDWREWFTQRLFGKTGTPHPDMLVLANLIKQEFEKAGVWKGIMKYPSKFE